MVHRHAAVGTDPVRRLSAVLAITVAVLAAQLVGAAWSGSLALLADAGHVLTDAGGLGLAVVAALLARRPPTPDRTWGYRRAEVLGAAVQAAVLLAIGGFVLVESVRRLVDPPAVDGPLMLVFGAAGLAGNLVALAVLARADRTNLNVRAATLEVLADALGSVAVLVAALGVVLGGWARADPLASLAIGALIVPRTVRLLRETVDVLLESTPRGLDLAEVRRHLLEVPHVRDVHDLHASQLTVGLPVLSAHVVVDPGCFEDGQLPELLDQLQTCVADHFAVSVEHSTFQFEAPGHTDHERGTHA